ncbi:MAG: excinuclease ABC subunit UvrB [Candidatus Aminicenantes bacterium]|nr:excinuclease ABC subunit UvrB [Candidatus Aminicenantes bacterium]
MRPFKLKSEYAPQGDQPRAINEICLGLNNRASHQVLMGVTGSGKTFTIANVIEKTNRPVLVISHNKTLAAQLYQEFKNFFPSNAVEYFVSYYDYYQPEAYIPSSNIYIAKEVTINEEIDRLRMHATNSLFQRRDVIVVASVSCIYGIGSPEIYRSMSFSIQTGQEMTRKQLLRKLVEIQYERNESEFKRGTFRVRGDMIDLFPSYEDNAYRIEINQNQIKAIRLVDPLRGTLFDSFDRMLIYPKSFFTTPTSIIDQAVDEIGKELSKRVDFFKKQDNFLEANRIEERTLFDLEMLSELGWCPGIENYSLYLSQRQPGQPPFTLMDYFPPDFITIIDESHVTIPQIRGMYHGDRSRKETLIQHGFRLPSALDNRPLNFKEFESKAFQRIYVSATPGSYESQKTGHKYIEQIIRPTGLIDPQIEVRPAKGQIDDLLGEIKQRVQNKERVLITTLTKKMAEDLSRYYHDLGLRIRFLHSDIDTLDRVKILRDLRKGKFDVLVGINLLREGLDLPEVSLVAILDADKEGFLRSSTSLIQTFGRAARNISGKAILYADTMTDSIQYAREETFRRRQIQMKYNQKNQITPQSIEKNIDDILASVYERDYFQYPEISEKKLKYMSPEVLKRKIKKLEDMMNQAAAELEFEKAAQYRDQLVQLQKFEVENL